MFPGLGKLFLDVCFTTIYVALGEIFQGSAQEARSATKRLAEEQFFTKRGSGDGDTTSRYIQLDANVESKGIWEVSVCPIDWRVVEDLGGEVMGVRKQKGASHEVELLDPVGGSGTK